MNIVSGTMYRQSSLNGAMLCTIFAALSGCHKISPTLVTGPQAVAATGTAVPGRTTAEYRLVPSDVIDVRVAYENDVSVDDVVIGTGGEISVPLIGEVRAAGLTAGELARSVEARLARYLRDPRVTVNVRKFALQTVTVEGSVEVPGVYDVPGTSSLLQAVALARGPTRTAELGEVIVFRTVNGQRMGAVFDLRRIRRGYDPDPLILGGDVVVVGYSELKGVFRDFLTAAPALAVFRPY